MEDQNKFIEDSKEEVYYDPLVKLLFNFFGSLLPLIVSVPIIAITTDWPGLNFFMDKGQFCLYSAAFFSPTLYLLYKHKKNKTFDKYLAIFISAFLGIIFCIVIYTVLRMGDFYEEGLFNFNTTFIQWISAFLFLGSLIVLFFAQSLENIRNLELQGYNYREEYDEKYDEFEKEFKNG